MLGGGGRGLGVLNVFVPLYLSVVIGLDTTTVALMYTVLVIGSVPGPIVAGWLSDRFGRKPLILLAYAGGVVSLLLFVAAGSNLTLLWLAIVLLSVFNFVESPQLQALLSDITPPALRDASFARLLHARLRRRLAVDRALRRGHRRAGRGGRPAAHVLADGARLRGGGAGSCCRSARGASAKVA